MTSAHRSPSSRALVAAIILFAAGANAAMAQADPVTVADTGFTLQWDARWRNEQVDNAAFARDATADTLRLRLGVLGRFDNGFSAFVEGADVMRLGGQFNSGANGNTSYPAVTDPSGGELNQAWLGWHGADVNLTVGRQRLQFDNQRWIGNSGWRQHEQTFDAVAVAWQPSAAFELRYAWLDRVHRVAGPRALNPQARARNLDTHLVNAKWTAGLQQWVGYAYLHEDRDVPAASSATFGWRWSGVLQANKQGFGWTLEAARQSDYANSPLSFHHDYWLVEPAWTHGPVTAKLGWERLGGNATHAMQTPLASLHPFNGWSDQFGAIPSGGLDDRSAALAGKWPLAAAHSPVTWTLAHHNFRTAIHDGRGGREWDAGVGFPLAKNLVAAVDYARYRASGLGHDDTKLWLQIVWAGARAW